jgi:transposase-like protein
MKAVKNVKASTLANFIRNHAAPGAEIHTDEFRSYLWLDASEFVHNAVNHGETYVKAGNIHTNGIENVWSLFKRAITGVFHKVSAKYLPLYLNEFAFRFNNREHACIMDKVLKTTF